MTKKKTKLKIAENPLAGGSLLNWIRLWRDNGKIERIYLPRAMYITLMTLIFAPFRALQKILFGKKIQTTRIEGDPIFVLGHFRNGGTHLLNCLTQDPQWGFMSTTQALLPELFLLGRPIREIFNLFLHEKRPMDNMLVSPESPEEPEHAICNTIPYGFYQGLCFPDRMMDYFDNSVSFENDPDREIQTLWEKAYRQILQACTLTNDGKQLILKNPPDTARVQSLLKLYPNAKFIFLYRNPYVMYPSIRNFYQAYIVDWQLKDISTGELEKNILEIYRGMMDRYHADKGLIPPGSLLEVKFEDLEARPLEELERIYLELGLEGFDNAKPRFQAYIDSQKDYQKNYYSLTPQEIKRIEENWSEDIRRWGYVPDGVIEIIDD